MIMDLLRQFGMNFNKEKAHDAIDGIVDDWEKSKGFTEEMMGSIPQETQDLLFNLITGGGVGGTIKTGTKAVFALSKGTLLKRFFEKFRGKPYSVKPVKTLKGSTGGDLDDLFQNIKNLESGGIKNILGTNPGKPLLTPEAIKLGQKEAAKWRYYKNKQLLKEKKLHSTMVDKEMQLQGIRKNK